MAEPPGRAASPEAGSSVAPVVVTTGAPSVRGLGTTIAPRRRATFHRTLLVDRRRGLAWGVEQVLDFANALYLPGPLLEILDH